MSTEATSTGFWGRWFGKTGAAGEDFSGTAQKQQRKSLMHAAENFHSIRVEDVMVPRAEIIAVAKDTPLDQLTNCFQTAGHSRLPVYNGTLDEPIGFVHVKDLLTFLALDAKGRTGKTYGRNKIINKIIRPVLFVPPSMAADALLRKMQVGRVHMAIVVDEYGGTDGLVTLEDLIEPIVGDIEDEHDDDEPEIIARKDKNGNTYWDANARADIEDFEAVIGREIATPKQDEEVDTLGGLVVSIAGRVPERGEIIRHPLGMEFEILEADARRIKRLRLRACAVPKSESKS